MQLSAATAGTGATVPAARRRQWALAVGLALLVHLALFAILARDFAARLPRFTDRTVAVTLERPARPQEPRERPKEAAPRPSPPQAAASPARPIEAVAPPFIAPGPGPGTGQGAGTGRGSGGASGAEERPTPSAPVIRIPCMGPLDQMSPLRRRECELGRSRWEAKALPKEALGLPSELEAEFEEAYRQRRQNDPTAKTGPVVKDMMVPIFRMPLGPEKPSAPPVFPRQE